MPPKGQHMSAEYIEKLRARVLANNPMKGKHPSKETLAKMSESHKRYRGELAPRWEGGRFLHDGYIMVYKPDHPRANHGYVREHRLIMEQIIGRILEPNEVVHHMNHISSDNRPENLMLLSRGKHTTIHNNERELVLSSNYQATWSRERRRKLRLERGE